MNCGLPFVRFFIYLPIEEVTPVVKLSDVHVLELFHGPTFAFKDVALQFLGNLFEYFLQKGTIQDRITILGATSGDTGSAAIHGLRGKKNVNCFIMYPKGKVTEIQERQMTTIPDQNVHCISIDVSRVECIVSSQ
jgi:threonine synthase